MPARRCPQPDSDEVLHRPRELGPRAPTRMAAARASGNKRWMHIVGGMVDTLDVGARLRQRAPQVLKLWEERVRQELPAAWGQGGPALLDHLPDFLETLARQLEEDASPERRESEERTRGIEHGADRAERAEYSIDQMVLEYQVLRQVLFTVLEEAGPLGLRERELILEAIGAGIRNATAEFARRRRDEREKSQAALRKANAALEAQVQQRTSALVGSESRFSAMVEAVKDYALFTVDPEGRITSWNAGAQRMKGYTAEEAIGQHFSMLYPEDGRRRDEPMAHLRTALIEGRFRGVGLRVRKNGQIHMADVSVTPMYEAGRLTGFVKVVADLTERNGLIQERDLTRSRAEGLEARAEERKAFVATLTHDLRAPLTVAKSGAQLITRSAGDPEKVRSLAGRIIDAVDRAHRMISDLLDASRVDAGEGLHLQLEPFDLHQLAKQVCEETSVRYPDRFAIQARGPTSGVWSREGLRRVLENLLSNALKYGDPQAQITTRIVGVGDHVLLSVHNLGTFIPAEEQRHLFQPFRRAAAAQAGEKPGWGLGLSLVQGIVEAHGGVVKVESYPKEGTTFTVDLPVDARAT